MHPLVGRVAIDEGQDEKGELWSVLARVEAVLFKEGSQDVELVRIRHRDGDFQVKSWHRSKHCFVVYLHHKTDRDKPTVTFALVC